ncbi:YHS domain-containing protein [Microbulbifer rhizosphaerae]|uniref:YHS domain-containing protein/copper chaperone CopZ n=1 Tax=Microbulbifer rhizosphaerae TaxID=1562603 RepID=A0A7W4ZCB3_9GAMM|nr:YHS domain-containing protein [Microbulbifer rhizosphaerae]MBB3063254.1 YHS domain-containing protein/copper chaperone CopZ [Microbulbifer rhizosphaerae]
MAELNLRLRQDPVCGQVVTEDSHPWSHLHIRYAFCSEHCQERFKKWPHLYVGDPTHGLSEKQRGKVVRKSHRIKLVEPVDRQRLPEVREAIESLMGIESVEISGDEIAVAYDLMQVSLRDIEAVIAGETGDLSDGMADRILRAMIHYSEECELDNLAHLASHYRA